MNLYVHEFPNIDRRWLLPALGIFLLPIFFLPIVIEGFDSMRGPRTLLFVSLAWIMALIGGKRSLWELNKPLALFGIYLVIWQVWLRLSSVYFYGYFLPLLSGILAFPYLASIDEDGQRKILKSAVVMGMIQSLVVIGQRLSTILPPWRVGDLTWPAFYLPPIKILGRSWLLFYPQDPKLIGNPAGTCPGSNSVAAFLCIVCILAFATGWGWANFVILPALFLTNTLGAILAAAGGIIYFLIKVDFTSMQKRKSVFWPILIICVLILLFAVQRHGWTDSHRLSSWGVAMRAWWQGNGLPEAVRMKWTWAHNPLIGFGPGSFQMIFPGLYQQFTTAASDPGAWNKMHNEYLQILWEYGLIGTGILIFFLRGIWGKLKESGSILQIGIKAAIVAIAINSLFFFPFQLTETSLLCLAMLAFVS